MVPRHDEGVVRHRPDQGVAQPELGGDLAAHGLRPRVPRGQGEAHLLALRPAHSVDGHRLRRRRGLDVEAGRVQPDRQLDALLLGGEVDRHPPPSPAGRCDVGQAHDQVVGLALPDLLVEVDLRPPLDALRRGRRGAPGAAGRGLGGLGRPAAGPANPRPPSRGSPTPAGRRRPAALRASAGPEAAATAEPQAPRRLGDGSAPPPAVGDRDLVTRVRPEQLLDHLVEVRLLFLRSRLVRVHHLLLVPGRRRQLEAAAKVDLEVIEDRLQGPATAEEVAVPDVLGGVVDDRASDREQRVAVGREDAVARGHQVVGGLAEDAVDHRVRQPAVEQAVVAGAGLVVGAGGGVAGSRIGRGRSVENTGDVPLGSHGGDPRQPGLGGVGDQLDDRQHDLDRVQHRAVGEVGDQVGEDVDHFDHVLGVGERRAGVGRGDEIDAAEAAVVVRHQRPPALGERPRDHAAPAVAEDVELEPPVWARLLHAAQEVRRVLLRAPRHGDLVERDRPAAVGGDQPLHRHRREAGEHPVSGAEDAVPDEQRPLAVERLPVGERFGHQPPVVVRGQAADQLLAFLAFDPADDLLQRPRDHLRQRHHQDFEDLAAELDDRPAQAGRGLAGREGPARPGGARADGEGGAVRGAPHGPLGALRAPAHLGALEEAVREVPAHASRLVLVPDHLHGVPARRRGADHHPVGRRGLPAHRAQRRRSALDVEVDRFLFDDPHVGERRREVRRDVALGGQPGRAQSGRGRPPLGQGPRERPGLHPGAVGELDDALRSAQAAGLFRHGILIGSRSRSSLLLPPAAAG